MTNRLVLVCLLALVVVAGCGSKREEPGKDWSGKPLDVTVQDKVNNVAFTIQAPAGMKRDERDSGDDAITKHWRADAKDYFSEPSFSVAYAAIPATDVEGFVRDAMLDADEVIAKKEPLADGFVLVHHTKDKGLVYARVMKKKGDVHLTCTASQARDGGVPSPDKTIAWLEQLCMSLTIL